MAMAPGCTLWSTLLVLGAGLFVSLSKAKKTEKGGRFAQISVWAAQVSSLCMKLVSGRWNTVEWQRTG